MAVLDAVVERDPVVEVKRLPKLEYQGKVPPILRFQRSIFSIGARDTTAIVVSRSCRCVIPQ